MIPLTVYQLGSGSRGNLTALEGPDGILLVDAGFTARECLRRLGEAGLARNRIGGIVLSHCHLDHARGAAILARRLKVPVWGSEFTLANLARRSDREEYRVLPLGGEVEAAGIPLRTHPAPHDIPGTVIMRFGDRFAVATDLGRVDAAIRDFLSGLEGLQLEFNHDRELLAKGPYPATLKARVASDRGHLANDQARDLLADPTFQAPTRALILAHLSGVNNRADLALAAGEKGLDSRPDHLLVADQDRPLPPIPLV